MVSVLIPIVNEFVNAALVVLKPETITVS